MLKKEKGIALQDIIIALLIMSLFTGLVATISYRIYIKSNFVKRNSTATNYLVNIFEYIEQESYENVTAETITAYINGLNEPDKVVISTSSDTTPYKATVNVTNTGNVTKQITVSIEYKLGKKTEIVEISRLKIKEIMVMSSED